jgi:tripartite-type tricarboxylate transporter receptor subunit TctC
VALLGGRVEAYVGTGASTVGHAQAGSVRVLAVFQKGKYDLFPDATPVGDAGYDATLGPIYYAVAPKGVPQAAWTSWPPPLAGSSTAPSTASSRPTTATPSRT